MIATKEIVFPLPGVKLRLAVAKNIEDLIGDPTDEDQIPYWADIWPAARGLAAYIWENVDFAGETVLELGAGIGVPSFVAALKGAQVTFSDYIPQALELAARNAQRNKLHHIRYHLGDWRNFNLAEQFNWIIGADIIYNPKLNPCLLGICQHNLKPGGRFLFAHAGRKVALTFLNELQALLGLKSKVTTVPVYLDEPYFPYQRIQVHYLAP